MCSPLLFFNRVKILIVGAIILSRMKMVKYNKKIQQPRIFKHSKCEKKNVKIILKDQVVKKNVKKITLLQKI